MSTVLDRQGAPVADRYPTAGEGATSVPALLPLERFLTEGCPADCAVLLPNTADVQNLAEEVLAAPLLVLDFPGFADGRGYSQARLLSRHPRFGGGLRAQGAAVVLDQLKMLRSCGITEFRLRDDQPVALCAGRLAAPG